MKPRLPCPGRSLLAFLAAGCLLCDQLCAADDLPGLCAPCRDSLPLNRAACTRCAEPCCAQGQDPPEDRICAHCRTAPPPFTHTLAPLLYQGYPKIWVRRLKSRFGLVEGRLLGELLGAAARLAVAEQRMPRPDLVLPVPLAPLRLVHRGHNQALPLAGAVARHLGVPLTRHGARRLRRTPSQQTLRRSARLTNLQRAFASRAWHGERIGIVDDVMTTGATAAALATALLDAGAGEVVVLCATRTPDRPR